MTREEAENRINDLAWKMRDVILEYNPNETFVSMRFRVDSNGLLNWLSYWNEASTALEKNRPRLDVYCPIPSEKMVRYRESLKEEEHEA